MAWDVQFVPNILGIQGTNGHPTLVLPEQNILCSFLTSPFLLQVTLLPETATTSAPKVSFSVGWVTSL